jgi:hypothetical protein
MSDEKNTLNDIFQKFYYYYNTDSPFNCTYDVYKSIWIKPSVLSCCSLIFGSYVTVGTLQDFHFYDCYFRSLDTSDVCCHGLTGCCTNSITVGRNQANYYALKSVKSIADDMSYRYSSEASGCDFICFSVSNKNFLIMPIKVSNVTSLLVEKSSQAAKFNCLNKFLIDSTLKANESCFSMECLLSYTIFKILFIIFSAPTVMINYIYESFKDIACPRISSTLFLKSKIESLRMVNELIENSNIKDTCCLKRKVNKDFLKLNLSLNIYKEIEELLTYTMVADTSVDFDHENETDYIESSNLYYKESNKTRETIMFEILEIMFKDLEIGKEEVFIGRNFVNEFMFKGINKKELELKIIKNHKLLFEVNDSGFHLVPTKVSKIFDIIKDEFNVLNFFQRIKGLESAYKKVEAGRKIFDMFGMEIIVSGSSLLRIFAAFNSLVKRSSELKIVDSVAYSYKFDVKTNYADFKLIVLMKNGSCFEIEIKPFNSFSSNAHYGGHDDYKSRGNNSNEVMKR